MLDNLLRAMLAPALLLIFILGTISAPGLFGFWIAIILFSLGIPLLTSIARSTLQTLDGEEAGAAFHPFVWVLLRWFLAIAFLPYEAYNSMDAILTTLYRLLFSHKNLLQWTTAAQTAHIFGLEAHRQATWLKMMASSLMTIFLIGAIQTVHGLSSEGGGTHAGIRCPIIFGLDVFASHRRVDQPTHHSPFNSS